MAELRKPRKIRNAYQILLKMVLLDAEFIEGFVKTKTSKNQRLEFISSFAFNHSASHSLSIWPTGITVFNCLVLNLFMQEMEASENPSLQSGGPDPMLFCTASKKNRFYVFSTRLPNLR